MVRYPCWLVIMPPRVKYGVFGMKSLECEINARVPKTMFDAATALAEQSDQTTGEIVRRALAQYLNRQKAKAAAGAAGSQIDEGLRQIVQDSLAASTDWQSFQSGLRANGYEVFPHGGGIGVRRLSDKAYVAKGSSVGAGFLASAWLIAVKRHPPTGRRWSRLPRALT